MASNLTPKILEIDGSDQSAVLRLPSQEIIHLQGTHLIETSGYSINILTFNLMVIPNRISHFVLTTIPDPRKSTHALSMSLSAKFLALKATFGESNIVHVDGDLISEGMLLMIGYALPWLDISSLKKAQNFHYRLFDVAEVRKMLIDTKLLERLKAIINSGGRGSGLPGHFEGLGVSS